MSKQKELFANEEIAEAEKTKLQPPPMYKVVLNNDDYTPMDFVVVVLQTVFAMSREKATQVKRGAKWATCCHQDISVPPRCVMRASV